MTRLFVSPHLDDVALSCGAQLLSRRTERNVVATVFSAASGRARKRYQRRRQEDRAALEGVGAEVRHLGLLDAPYRLEVGFDAPALSSVPSLGDVECVGQLLVPLIEEVRPAEVWLPLGIGGHVDHLAVFACHQVVDARVRFYLERPYSFDRSAVADRHAGIFGLRLERTRWPREVGDAVIELVERYESQVRWLFDDADVRTAYVRHAMDEGQFVEEVAVLRDAPAEPSPNDNTKSSHSR